MPAASLARRVVAAAAVALALLATGCQSLDDAGRGIGRSQLINDLAGRLDAALASTYAAEYQLAGGATASIVQTQQPAPRAAYIYPAGLLTVTGEATAECDTGGERPVCTLTPPPAQAGKPPVTTFTSAKDRGLVTPPMVIGLLTSAALDPTTTTEETDSTIAGRHATCVEVRPGSAEDGQAPFKTCVTSDGVLGSFTGTVDDTPVDLALVRYRDSVESSVFELPADALVVDRRDDTD